MDFLDFEEETQIDESDAPEQSVHKLLDDPELLQEIRATTGIAQFLETHAALLLNAALTRDGAVDADDATLDALQKYTPADRRGYVAAEVLCGPDVACVAILKACAADSACWAALSARLDDPETAPMRDSRWARLWLRLLDVARFDTVRAADPLLDKFAAAAARGSANAADVAGALLGDACRADRAVRVAWTNLRPVCSCVDAGAAPALLLTALAAAPVACAARVVGDARCLASVVRATRPASLEVVAAILRAAADARFDAALRVALRDALAPEMARVALLLDTGAFMEKVAAARVLRGAARCPGANGALGDAGLDACADALFRTPHADVLHVHAADVLLAIVDRKPQHARAAARLERLLFRDGAAAGGLLARIRSALTGLARPANSRDSHLVVLGEAVCAALREDEARPGAGLVPDVLYARREALDAWLHFVEDLARLTARKVAPDFAVPAADENCWDAVDAG